MTNKIEHFSGVHCQWTKMTYKNVKIDIYKASVDRMNQTFIAI